MLGPLELSRFVDRKVFVSINLKPLEAPAVGFKLLNCNTAEGSFSKEFS